MSALLDVLTRYDDDAWAALANRGLLRRARKDLESATVGPASWEGETVHVPIADRVVTMDARGPGHASCTCPSTSTCQHIVAIGLWLAQTGAPDPALGQPVPEIGGPTEAETGADQVGIGSLIQEVLAIDDEALARHAGKAGWRWATERLADLEFDEVQIAGDRMLVVTLERPRVTYRYAGGGLAGMHPDVQVTQQARVQALAVLAVRRAHGGEVPVPEKPIRGVAAELVPLRAKVRTSVKGLLVDTVALGTAHLSEDMSARYESAATSAQGAEYHRLARLLRRMADRVTEIRGRAAGADTAALVDEAALGLALIEALEASGPVEPERFVGRARAVYDEVREMEIIGLGAQVWSSRTGFRGVTAVFWWPDRNRFCSWTDARPDTVVFDPRARWNQPGPWSGLRAPAATAGAQVRLRSAQLAGGRLSSRESAQALVTALSAEDLVARLPVAEDFAAVANRPPVGLLDTPDPLRDWVVLRPAVFGPTEYDPLTQRLTWYVADADGVALPVQVTWTPITAPLVEAVERRAAQPVAAGTLLVARVFRSGGSVIAEPLSLIRPEGTDPVESLHLAGPGTAPSPAEAGRSAPGASISVPIVLRDMRSWLTRTAERGTGAAAEGPLLAEWGRLTAAARAVGFDLFREPTQDPSAVQVLRGLGVLRQVELLLTGS